jgi:D-alanyl-D-alanine carboxypeptidase (penicillin-binding protein 5/6)
MKREVASLTKMMTFYTIVRLMKRWNMQPKTTLITISYAGSQVTGTTADLTEGDVLSIEQLFHGMMLPSGNDAAYTLAEYFGKQLKDRKKSVPIP